MEEAKEIYEEVLIMKENMDVSDYFLYNPLFFY